MRRLDYREPCTVWRMRLITEICGPVGKGWGTEHVSLHIASGKATVVVKAWWRDVATGNMMWTPEYSGSSAITDSDSIWLATEDATNAALAYAEQYLPYRTIPLSRGCATYVDAQDYPSLTKTLWSTFKSPYTLYAGRGKTIDGKNTTIMMHREIISPSSDQQVDHRNRDGLDNRRRNLRVCSNQQNMWNTRSRPGSSQYKGVSWNKARNKWSAQITVNGKKKHLGFFVDETQAALAYDKYAKELFGDFSSTNF